MIKQVKTQQFFEGGHKCKDLKYLYEKKTYMGCGGVGKNNSTIKGGLPEFKILYV